MNNINPNYYIPINDTTLKLSVFWPSDTESRINELRISEPIHVYHYPLKRGLRRLPTFAATLRKISLFSFNFDTGIPISKVTF